MPPKSAASQKSPERGLNEGVPLADIGEYLQDLRPAISHLQGVLDKYGTYDEKFHHYEQAAAREKHLKSQIEEKRKRIHELEADIESLRVGIATFDSVHMRTSLAAKEENVRLTMRLRSVTSERDVARRELEERTEKWKDWEKAQLQNYKQEREKSLKERVGSVQKASDERAAEYESKLGELRGLLEAQRAKNEEADRTYRLQVDDMRLREDGLRRRIQEIKADGLQPENLERQRYSEQWAALAEKFHEFCKTHFMTFPQGTVEAQRKSQQDTIDKNLRITGFRDLILDSIPIHQGQPQAWKLLRLACVQHVISVTLCRRVFQTFALPQLDSNKFRDSAKFLEDCKSISHDLSKESPRKEAIWRNITLSALERQFGDEDAAANSICTEIINLTWPLMPDSGLPKAREDLTALLKLAFAVWRPARKNATKIIATINVDEPTPPDHPWETTEEQDDFSVLEEETTDFDSERRVLCLFPRILDAAPETAAAATDEGGGNRPCIYYAGNALYADAGSYVCAKKEEENLRRLREQAAIQVDPARIGSRRSRRNSDVPRSPRVGRGSLRDGSTAPSMSGSPPRGSH